MPALGQPAILSISVHRSHPQPRAARAPSQQQQLQPRGPQAHFQWDAGRICPAPARNAHFLFQFERRDYPRPGKPRTGALRPGQPTPGRAPGTAPDLPNMAAAPALSGTVAIAPRFRRALRQGRPAAREAVAGPVPPWTAGRNRWTWPRPR